MSDRKSFGSSRDARETDFCWLNLSSSKKCEECLDDFLENREIRITSNTSTPRAIPAMVIPLTTDFMPSAFALLSPAEREPGGKGGAGPDDHEFPPVLYVQ